MFTNRFGVTNTEVSFDRICRENGVRHLSTAPYSPIGNAIGHNVDSGWTTSQTTPTTPKPDSR